MEGYKTISRVLKVPKSTVSSIIRKWKEYGMTQTLTRTGCPTKQASYHVQPVAAGCIIFWGHGCAADAVPSITSAMVLILPFLEGSRAERMTPPGVSLMADRLKLDGSNSRPEDPEI